MTIYYRGQNVGTRRVDFLVADKVMVELKAVENLLPVHFAQAINYCEVYNIPDGLLLNFGSTKLGFKRVVNKKCRSLPKSIGKIEDILREESR